MEDTTNFTTYKLEHIIQSLGIPDKYVTDLLERIRDKYGTTDGTVTFSDSICEQVDDTPLDVCEKSDLAKRIAQGPDKLISKAVPGVVFEKVEWRHGRVYNWRDATESDKNIPIFEEQLGCSPETYGMLFRKEINAYRNRAEYLEEFPQIMTGRDMDMVREYKKREREKREERQRRENRNRA